MSGIHSDDLHSEDRFSRQADLVPAERLASQTVTLIGVGAIGRQVALQLASIGAQHLTLIDFDRVERTNVTTQAYRHDQIGLTKVAATAEDIRAIEPDAEVQTICDRFRPHQKTGHTVFTCVDSIAARSAIWRKLRDRCQFWCDGRMRGEVVRVLCSGDPRGDERYADTLFDAAEAHTGSCTSASTVYAANLAASLMVHQFTRWLREIPVEPDQTLNLLASELMLA